MAIGACRPPEPSPSLNNDVGSDGEILMPTPTAWHDPAIAKGTAEWKSFRKPSENSTTAPTGTAQMESNEPESGGVEPEIMAMLEEYGALVREGKYADALDYLVEDQAVAMEKGIEVLASFDRKLREVAETIPETADRADRLSKKLALANVLALSVRGVKATSPTEATGSLFDPNAPEDIAAAVTAQVFFHKSADGDWFIEAPHFATLANVFPRLEATANDLGGLVEAVKTNSLEGAERDAAVARIKEIFDRMIGASAATPEQNGGSAALMPGQSPASNNSMVSVAAISPEILARGAAAYQTGMCFKCHGDDGTGGVRGPNLTDDEWLHADGSVESIQRILRSGVPRDQLKDPGRPFAMNPATNLITDDEAIDALAVYVAQLHR